MTSFLKRGGPTVRAGMLGTVSGMLSCAMAGANLIYIARLQKTVDNMVWPGIVFALVVLLPLSRSARDAWARTAAASLASMAAYPVAWQIAERGIGSSWAYTIGAFACAGLLGSLVLAGVFLCGRPGWRRAATVTVVAGAAIGGLMGACLRAAMSGVPLPFSAVGGLGFLMVLWQAAVGASLGWGLQARAVRPGG